jgi:hypothetical protein
MSDRDRSRRTKRKKTSHEAGHTVHRFDVQKCKAALEEMVTEEKILSFTAYTANCKCGKAVELDSGRQERRQYDLFKLNRHLETCPAMTGQYSRGKAKRKFVKVSRLFFAISAPY